MKQKGQKKLSPNEFVLDAYALLALLQKEPGYGRVESLLKSAVSGEVRVHISAINLAEVQYQVLKRGGSSAKILAALEALPLHVASADMYLPHVVDLRVRYGMPLSNCFAAALAQDSRLPLITGDREFRKLGSTVNIEWLR